MHVYSTLRSAQFYVYVSTYLLTGIPDCKASTDSIPNDNEKNCKKLSTRDQGTQTGLI